MATHKRALDQDYYVDYTEQWETFKRENNYNADVSKATLKKQAKQAGVDFEAYSKTAIEEYYAMRDVFHDEMKAIKAEQDQITLIRNNSLDSTCSVFQRADRILTGLSVNVFLNEGEETSAPAYNDGRDVTFNANAIKAIDEETIRSLHGLNYHEIGHLLFTPRVGSQLGKWAVENKQRQQVFNILEDCREETFLVAKYPSVRPFLTALIGEYIAKDLENYTENFILLAGRRYFSLSARKLSAKMFAETHGEDKAKLIYQVCSEYRTLVFPRDYARAQELIEKLIESETVPESMETQSGCSHRKGMRNGKPEGEKAQQALQDVIKGDEAGEGETESDMFGDSADWGTTGDSNTGEVDTAHSDFTSKEFDKAIEQAVELAKSDKEVAKKVSDTNKAIIKDGSTRSILGRARNTKFEPAMPEVTTSRMFGQELERLRIDSDPMWNTEKPSGKLNVRRAMHADINDLNKLFDRWEIGNDDYDIEACILIDRSGSMYSEIGSACRSAWIIKRAIEKINGNVSVMTFSTVSRTLYSADERALANEINIVEANGGTDPYYALLESERIFMQSPRKTKLMFMLTDGAFDSKNNDPIIERLNDNGVMTNVVFLTGNEDWAKRILSDPKLIKEYSHQAQNFQLIAKPNDLVKVAKDVVKNHLKKVAR